MKEQSAVHSTFVVERSYPKPPERVFAAFADATQKRRWFAEGESHDVVEFEMDFRIGGTERTRSRHRPGSPIAGLIITHDATYEDILPNQRIVTAATMMLGDKRISVSLVTVEFLSTDKGTDLICTHQGVFFEGGDGPQRREGGWRKLFEQLANELTR